MNFEELLKECMAELDILTTDSHLGGKIKGHIDYQQAMILLFNIELNAEFAVDRMEIYNEQGTNFRVLKTRFLVALSDLHNKIGVYLDKNHLV